MMNSKTACRLLGWLFVCLGTAGAVFGHFGTYLQFTKTESYVSLALGILSVMAARRRRRVSAATAMMTGLIYLAWGTSGMFVQHPILGSVEPLDSVIHSLAAIWGIGISSYDVMLWRKLISSGIEQ